MTIGTFSVRNPVLVNIITILILAIGFLSILRLPQEQFAEVPFFFINITVPHPGVSAEDIESSVTAPIETAMQGLDQLSKVRSVTSDGVAQIQLEFDQGIQRSEFDRAFQDVRNRFGSLNLPDGILGEQIREFSSNDFLPVIELVVHGDLPYAELNAAALRLSDRIEGIRGVSGVQLIGSRDPVIYIEPAQQRLETLGISLDRVVQQVQVRSATTPGGSLNTPGRSFLLRTVGDIQSAQDFDQVILRTADSGQVVQLSDVAEIRRGFDDEGLEARYNGRSAIALRVAKVPGGSSVDILDAARQEVDRFTQSAAALGLEVDYFNDSTVQIRESIDVLVSNAIFGLILLVAILLVFFGLRNALMTALGIPVTIAATAFILELFGETLNSNTLFALVLVLGLIVDHAIVIIENSFRLQQEGLSKHQAAIRGVDQVAVPVWAATATTVAAFVPLMFLPGLIGRFLRVVPLTVSIALLVSTFEATFFLPSHFADWPGKIRDSKFNQWFVRVQKQFSVWLERMYTYRGRVLLAAAVIMVLVFAMTGFIKQNLFDADDYSVAYVDIQMPPGTPIRQTAVVVRQFEQRLLPLVGQGDVTAINSYVGFSAGSDENVSNPTVGQLVLDLLDVGNGRQRTVNEILQEIEGMTADISGAESVRYRKQQSGPPVDAPISFRLFGDSFENLEQAAVRMRQELAGIEGVYDVSDNLQLSSPELRIVVDEYQASQYGLDRASVGRFIRAAFDGVQAGSVFIDNEEVSIIVRYDLPRAMTYERFAQLRISTVDGRSVPLDAVARIEQTSALSQIRRLDGRREVTIEAQADDSVDLGQVNARIQAIYDTQIEQQLPDVQLRLGGQFAEFGVLLFDILRVFLVGIFLIYTILAAQFKSYTKPMLIMFSVPFAFVGIILYLILTGTPLSTTVIYAGVALAGIAVNDSIVLISFINEELAAGIGLKEAIITGATSRLRPILLTSITTIAGLLPVALGIGGKSAVWSPMAGTIVFGLIFSTLSALVIIPCVYGLLFDRKKA